MAKTERLYYNDPHLLEFDACIVDRLVVHGAPAVVLDRTAFYPTSGGQPNDLGSLNGVDIVDCREDEETGAVIHLLKTDLSGASVHGLVDRERRIDHMQQHSGQHVLSQAFVEMFGWRTVSFHMSAQFSTIDLATESVNWEQIARVEDLANRVIRDNRSVAIGYVSSENVGEAGLRKPTERVGEIRIIDIGGFDKSACGGTHVRATAEIGPILVTRLERMKKQTRLEFLCGARMVRYAREANRTLEAISKVVSAPPLQSAPAVRTIWDDLQQSRKRVEELQSSLLDHEAAQFPVHGGIAAAVSSGRGIDEIKALAQKICGRPGVVTLLVDNSDQLRIVVARSADSAVDAASVLKQTMEKFGGRGGGRPALAQGGGLTADSPYAVLEFARSLVSR